MTDSPNQRLCKDCKEWIDARAPVCYLCGEEQNIRNEAIVNAVHTDRVNSNLMTMAGNARAEQAVSSRIPSGNLNGRTGPTQAYNTPSNQNLVQYFKKQLRESGFGE